MLIELGAKGPLKLGRKLVGNYPNKNWGVSRGVFRAVKVQPSSSALGAVPGAWRAVARAWRGRLLILDIQPCHALADYSAALEDSGNSASCIPTL